MRCERLIVFLILFVVPFAACSRETPAPPQQRTAAPVQTTAPPVTTTTSFAPPQTGAAYEDAITWFRTVPSFRFVVVEEGVRAEGEMKRERVGAESVTFRANGQEWRAASGARGVMWERRTGDSWAAVDTPPFGNRLYQRVTIAFDPQKKEGTAQLVAPGHFRFTDANSGKVHEVWVAGGRIERMKIGDTMELQVVP
ncbi:MAG TPA: hypothetical protein VEK57_23155 [Thermoanaerobaculia bacterium]|nr:hypothetical protein [Thermoanaerobaculia bacterium]